MDLPTDLTPLAVAICLAMTVTSAHSQDETPRRHIETISSSDHEYLITMGGTMDGPSTRDPVGYGHWTQDFKPMRVVRLANVGDSNVVNPWLLTNDRGRWRTCKEMIEHVTAPYDDDVQRATALWWWQTRHRFHTTTGDAENNDPVKVWNIYGHTLCGNDAHVLADAWRTAGFRTRHPRIQGHSISEVWAGERWNLLDGDENILTLLRDNETGASEADIRRDHDLIKRTHCYGILRADSRRIDEFSASLYAHDTQPDPDQDLRSHLDHEMKFTLRPGEALVWAWEDRGKIHGSDERMRQNNKPLANGWWEFEPRLTPKHVAANTESAEGITVAGAEVRGEGSLVYRIRAPYALVGGKVEVEGQGLALAISWDGDEWIALAGDDLDPHFPFDGPARYEYLLRVQLAADAVLKSLRVANDLQMAPLCMPYLTLGENRISYTDETEGPRQVEVTHEWVTRSDNRPPTAPAASVFPADGATLNRTQFTFEWQPATDPDGDEIADYQFQLSRHADMRWPLSPNFFKLISRTANKDTASFTIPYIGLLNPATTYYWQVRARDAKSLWGAWSDVWSFEPGGPGVPGKPAMRFNKQLRVVSISWRDNPAGSEPVAWKIYGSDEQGFTASDNAYEIWMGNQKDKAHDWQPIPANLMTTTGQRSIQVVGADLQQPNANKAFYRVVAVDTNGIESGPSDYVEMPRPLICSPATAPAAVGQAFAATVRTISSQGDLRCRTLGTGQSYNAAFWDIEHPIYSLVNAPDWVEINAETGELTGVAPDNGPHAVTVKVEIEDVGEDIIEMTITAGK